jgi:hypothetical protein
VSRRLNAITIERLQDNLYKLRPYLTTNYIKQLASNYNYLEVTIYYYMARVRAGIPPMRLIGGPRRVIT